MPAEGAAGEGGERPALAAFLERWAEVEDLGRAASVLSWDQETQMPPSGLAARGRLQATLAGLRHRQVTAPALAEALAAARAELEAADAADPEVALARDQLAQARRQVERATRIPESLARALAEATTLGHQAWAEARAAADFARFEPSLAGIVRLKREEALCLADGGRPYDALLDQYEPGATEAELVPLFATLRGRLAPLVGAAAESGREVDESPARGRFPRKAQHAFGRAMAAAIGFDFEAGRLDLAPHPFCTGFDASDVRLTWRFQRDDFRPALFGILHEAGHGLFEQGLPAAWMRTPLGSVESLGLHESQSRLWENLVGRSRGFWEWAVPRFREHFPASLGVTVEQLWPALHTIRPSLIRVEADQGTYDLHVAVRFEVERALFAGDLEVGDLPGAWDDLYGELLGLRAPTAADGVLQDIHWSMGAFGYFPTYTLGNLIGAQLFRSAGEALGDLEAQFARGEFAPLLGWLREHVHRHGCRYSAKELVRRATGRELAPDAFLADRERIAREAYGVGG